MRNEQNGLAGRHGRLYKTWHGMISRCHKEGNANYFRYGARGISVCAEWHNFANFVTWALSHDYANNLSIDRIDVDGDYEPGNCRWADDKTQSNNRRDNIFYEYADMRATLPDWARIVAINFQTLRSRVLSGWPIERALLERPGARQ